MRLDRLWKQIFFVYSLLVLAINAGIFLFTSMGIFKLINCNRNSDYDWYRNVVIIIIAENVIFVMKYIITKIISDTPKWIADELNARKVRRSVYEEKNKVSHFKIKQAFKGNKRSNDLASSNQILTNTKNLMGKEATALKRNLNYCKLAQ